MIAQIQDPHCLGIGVADANTGWVVEVFVSIFYGMPWYGSSNYAHRQVLAVTLLDGLLLITKIEIFFVLIGHLL